MTKTAIVVIAGALATSVACTKPKEQVPQAAASASASASPTASASAVAKKHPMRDGGKGSMVEQEMFDPGIEPTSSDSTLPNEDCAPACEHRKSCKVEGSQDKETCVSECESVSALFVKDSLGDYVKSDCAAAKAEEPQFRNAVRCQKACAHYASCVSNPHETEPCIKDCAMAGLSAKKLDDYAAWTCNRVKDNEAALKLWRQGVRACKHVLECGVPGDMETCLKVIKQKSLDEKKLGAWESDACDGLKKAVIVYPKPTPNEPHKLPHGWFGSSWVDANGRTQIHNPPPPPAF